MDSSSKRLVLVVIPAIVAMVGARSLGQQAPLNVRPGDTVTVTSDDAPLQVGEEVIARVKKGDRLSVTAVRHPWVGVEVRIGGEMKRGWIHIKHLERPAPPAPPTQTAPAPSPARPGEWPQWRGPKRDGHSPDVGLLKAWPPGGPRLVWKATGIGEGFSSVAVCKGMVYTTGDVGQDLVLTCLDMNGNTRWQVRHGPRWTSDPTGSRGSPVVDGDRLYLLSAHGLLKCYDAATGAEKWKVDLPRDLGGNQQGWGYAESPLVYGNMLVLTPGGRNCIAALNKETGQPLWTSTGLSDPAHHSSCIAVEFQGHPMIVQMVGGGMVAVDARNGQFLWRCNRAVGGAACASPVYADGYCFGATGYGNGGACVKLSVEGGVVRGQQVWETKEMISHHGGYLILNGYLYGNHLDGWNCLELATGRKVWGGRGVGKGSLCYADGMLYTFGEGGGRMGLVRATPEGFEQTGQLQVEGRGPSWAYPVVVGGRLYLRYSDNLYCFDVRDPNYK